MAIIGIGNTAIHPNASHLNVLRGAGAPAANLGAGVVRTGDIYVNTTTGALHTVTATNGTTTVTWSIAIA